MNECDQAELEALKREHSALRTQLEHLGERIEALQRESATAEAQTPRSEELCLHSRSKAGDTPSPTPEPSVTPPPPLPRETNVRSLGGALLEAICPACLRTVEFLRRQANETVRCPCCEAPLHLRLEAATAVEIPVATQPEVAREAASPGGEETAASAPESSWEMRFGMHWLVRLGAVAILTGLVFTAHLAYKNWVIGTTPAVKVMLLYLLGAAVFGIGAFLQRSREALQRYGQVLMATGFAAVYFTTYAAHHFEALRVIHSSWLAGGLLLALAAGVVWQADRSRSEALALFAVLLAYYTSIINPIGLFTLFSNLVLTLAAVFFLIRNRWATLSFLSLAATYGSFVYWRFHQELGWLWRWNLPAQEFWLGALFLAGYWVAFTAPVFASRDGAFTGGRRATFLTLNNGALFALVGWTVPFAYPGSFWKFALGFGAVLLGLSALARRALPEEPVVRGSYTTQGLLLVTLGFLTYFTGPQLAMVLAAESVVLLVLGYRRDHRLLRAGAYVTATLAVLAGLDDFPRFDRTGLMLGIGMAAFLFFNGWWVDYQRRDQAGREDLCPRTGWFVGLGLLTLLLATWQNTAEEVRAPVFAALALIFALSHPVLRLRELTLGGQGFLLLSHALWLGRLHERAEPWPWWNPALVIAVTLALGHWWQHQRSLSCEAGARQFAQSIFALAVVMVLHAWLAPLSHPHTWLWLSAVLAIVLTGYGVATRAWLVAVCGQVFVLVSAWQFLKQVAMASPPWALALVPIATLAGMGLVALAVLRERTPGDGQITESILRASLLYRAAATLLGMVWIAEYVAEPHRFWVYVLCGAVLFAWAGVAKRGEVLWFSGMMTVAGFAHFWMQSGNTGLRHLPDLAAILALAVQQRIARHHADRWCAIRPVHTAAIVLASATLWLLVTRVVQQAGSGFYYTAAWAGLAFLLFIAGLGWKESAYRRCGLALIGLALCRVGFVDVWKLETFYKIVALMGLGVVLLTLGFIYNKFQERIRQWL
jgi:uncharacterized membrane protein